MSTATDRVVPCVLMRAGTSRGPFFLREWLPADERVRDEALIGAIGASDLLQLDGVGGGSTLTSKVADGPRARGAFLLRVELDPPWAMRIEDGAPLSLVVLTRGAAWLAGADRVPQELRPADVVIAPGPAPYLLGDDPTTPVKVVIEPGPRCVSVDGRSLDTALDPGKRQWRTAAHGYSGVRTWGNTDAGATQLLVGTYRMRSAVGQRLTAALPPLAVLPGFGSGSGLFAALAEEIGKDELGQDVVLDRLLDLLLVAALRTWFSRAEVIAPPWYRAGDDPLIGRGVRLLIERPDRPWTVATLAAAAGASRTAFARRFSQLVGEPPMTFLAGWRLAMAADLLRDTDTTLESVARAVGYGSPFALSTAFKRAHGISPQGYRRQTRSREETIGVDQESPRFRSGTRLAGRRGP